MTEKKDNIRTLKLAASAAPTPSPETPPSHTISATTKETLSKLLSRLDETFPYAVSDNALTALSIGINVVLDGIVDDIAVFVHKSSGAGIDGSQLLLGTSQETKDNFYKFLMLLEANVTALKDDFVFGPPEIYYEE